MNASPPLANLITLGTRDLPALRNFYRTLGWPQIMTTASSWRSAGSRVTG
jgi:hypothetical protein